MEIDRTWSIPTGSDKTAEVLLAPFTDIDDFEKNIDSAVARAKSEVTKWRDFDALFKSQITTLKERGVPEPIMGWFQNEKERVLEQAMKMDFGKGNVPFLPVVPLVYRTLYDLMAMIRTVDGKVGYTEGSYSIIDIEETVSSRYIFDVSDGTTPLEGSEKRAEKILAQQNRFPLTIVEVIALCVHTDVLSRIDYLSALGSRLSGEKDKHPSISAEKNFGGRPKFCWGYVQNWPSDSAKGVPSRDCWPRVKPLIDEYYSGA